MSLIIAGLGIKFLSHLTKETEKIIQDSDKVLYLANDSLFPEWIQIANKNSESLDDLYFSRSNRYASYNAIKEKILSELECYQNVSFIIYGNPNLLVQVTSLVTCAAKSNGHEVYILPAVSSLDCLLADLNINPGDNGMQLFEATELIVYRKTIDLTSHVVIFQAAIIGQDGHGRNKENMSLSLKILCSYLSEIYSKDQLIIFYEANQYPGEKPKISKLSLADAFNFEISSKTTIYIAPAKKGEIDIDMINQIKSICANFNAPSEKPGI